MQLLKELREKRKQVEAEINAHSETITIGETQFNSSFLGEALRTIPETPVKIDQPSRNILQTPSVIRNTSFASTPGPTQLTGSLSDPVNERWSKTDFPWSRDIKKALNS